MTAKEQFIASPHADKLRSLYGQDYFREALNFAVLHMAESLPGAIDPAKGWDCHSRMQGALQFRSILETLALTEKEAPKDPSQKFNYDIYDNPRRRT